MDSNIVSALIAVATLAIVEGLAGIIWAIRQEGRLNYVEKLVETSDNARQKQIDDLKSGLAEVKGEYKTLTSKLIEDIRLLSEGIVEIKTILREREREE